MRWEYCFKQEMDTCFVEDKGCVVTPFYGYYEQCVCSFTRKERFSRNGVLVLR